MYKATKQWQPNHYMQLFAKDGIFYFIVYVLSPLFQSSELPSHSDMHVTIMYVSAKIKLTTLNFQEYDLQYQYGLDPNLQCYNKQHFTAYPGLAYLYDSMPHHAPVHHQRTRAV